MSRQSRRGALAVSALAALTATTLAASPAFAAPWDGSDIVFGPGEWDVNTFRFAVSDVRLVPATYPVDPTLLADVWDYTGSAEITSVTLGLDEEPTGCDDDAQIDVEVEAGTGDLVYTCTSPRSALVDADLEVSGEIRVFVGGEVVRSMTTITNLSDAAVVINEVEVETNFGSTGLLYDYDNQSDAVLAVPAPENGSTDYAAALNTAGAQWIVHWNNEDAPGGIIIGNRGAAIVAEWDRAIGDTYDATIGPIEIPAGESRTIVTFSTWAPQPLIAGGYTNNNPPASLLDDSADEIVAGMAQFTELSGALLTGIDDVTQVVNWGPADEVVTPEPEAPQLADTGSTELMPALAAVVLLLGVGGLLLARRRVQS